MKSLFYPKLAFDGVKKNAKLYVPYIMTGALMTLIYYIISFLTGSEIIKNIKGGRTLCTMFPLASYVIIIFSVIFLFYTNSFLIRRRYKEFGLYNILGMNKKNLSFIIILENIFVGLISLAAGLGLGILLSKGAELVAVNVLNAEVNYKYSIDFGAVAVTARTYGLIYLLLLANSLVRVYMSKPLQLLKSGEVGEKAPKGNWILAIVGVVMLVIAYVSAVSIEKPLAAIVTFFIDVALVIVATYLIFIAASVVFCKLLQKNKKYYYKSNHFISVSSMVYRMKRNGAGLASICILVTMVLVMLSSIITLYVGANDSIEKRYPADFSMHLNVGEYKEFNEDAFGQRKEFIAEVLSDKIANYAGTESNLIKNACDYRIAEMMGFISDEKLELLADDEYTDIKNADRMGYIEIISLEDYNRIEGKSETLTKDECLLYGNRMKCESDTFDIAGRKTYNVKKVLDKMRVSSYSAMQIVGSLIVVIPDYDTTVEELYNDVELASSFDIYWNYEFDMNADAETQIEAMEILHDNADDIVFKDKDGGYEYFIEGKESAREEFFAMYAGLFLVGIFLSIVFLFAAVLIIYYKQISEGYEDKQRFAIMKKVGITKREIKKSINSQVLTVFFAPLAMAGIHLVFAFPLIWKVLQLFMISNFSLMVVVTICCFIVFGVFYAIVYNITSNVYFSIVDGKKA